MALILNKVNGLQDEDIDLGSDNSETDLVEDADDRTANDLDESFVEEISESARSDSDGDDSDNY